ncbi:MAG: hypothetical protein PHR36_04660 [Patescibacteria group bacterium]|nr:hypothetical protein [Patescibacteria group bacterium]
MFLYYRLKYGKYYLVKVAVLVLAAVLGELVIWWALVREESVDWITGQIIHNPSPYAITQMEDGRTIVGNVVKGFEITLPSGWQARELRSPDFYLNEGENVICEVKSVIKKTGEDVSVASLLKEQEGFSRISAGLTPAIKKEETTEQGNFIYELEIPIGQDIIGYTLFADKDNRNKCRLEFEKIRRSFLYY